MIIMKKFTLFFMFFISLSGFAQLALEGFEGTWTALPLNVTGAPAGPDGWYIRNEKGLVQRWGQATTALNFPVHSGSAAAYINRETVEEGTTSEDWLITKVFTVPNNAQLKFWSRLWQDDDQGTIYKVLIGTNPADISTFTELQQWTETQLNTVQTEYEQKIVNIPNANNGQQRYIAFVMMGNDADRWLIDDVQVTELCNAPTGLSAVTTASSATLSWVSTSANFEVQYVPNGTAPAATGTPVTGNTYTTPATLTPSTTYQFYVRAMCATDNSSTWAGPFTFSTTQIPGTLTYTDGFESTPQWTLQNGTATNKWMIGTAVANGGTHSLYISNNNADNAYTTNAPSVVHAYRDLQMPAAVDQLTLSFNWRNIGEDNFDFLRVWLVPASWNPTPGTQITAANSGGVQVGGNFSNNGNWTTFNGTINAAAFSNGIARLVFEWNNDDLAGTQPPIAVDNINLSVVTCPPPANFALGFINNNTATFTWTGPTSVTPTYDFYFSTNNTAPTSTTNPTSSVPNPTLTLNSLSPTTQYYIWIRSNCGGTDKSTWVGPIAFTTTQVPSNLDYTQDFESTHNFGFSTGTTLNRWAVGTATANGGLRSLYVSNDNGVTNAYTTNTTTVVHAYRDVLIPAGTSEVDLSFDWKGVAESCCDYLRVWMIPATFTPVAGTQLSTANSGGTQVGGNFNNDANWKTYTNTINVSGYAGQVRRLVFEWRNDFGGGNQPPAAVDNILLKVVTCPKPINLTATATSSNATLNWTPQGAETSWEVYVVPTGSAAPTAATVGSPANTNTNFVYEPLDSATSYQYYVRAVCGTNDKSAWSGPVSFTTAIANDTCSGAVTLPVNAAAACTDVTNVVLTGANPSALATCSGANNGPDVWYKFTATNTSHTVSLSDFTGTAQPVILSLYEDACGNASALPYFCSANNAINATGLTPGTTYLVRLTLNSASPNLNLGAKICVSTPPPPSSSNQTDCLITTINYSFESPDISGTSPSFLNHNTVQGWRTTANDQVMEYWPAPNYINVPAYEGNQFIELNANENQGTMGVYQDYATPQPTTFVVKFAHRGRQGTDTMKLLAGPADQPVTTYAQVGPNYTTSNAAWVYYGADNSITYTVPAGQTITRFYFQAVSTSTGDTSVGNFLDAITFTANNGITSANPAVANCETNVVNVTAQGSGVWTPRTDNPAASVIADASANNTTISGFTVPGVYKYDWTTPYCTSELTITYTAPEIAAPTGTDVYNYCVNETPAQLTAQGLPNYTLNWYNVAAGGTPLAGAPTPDTSVPGVYKYYVGQKLDVCESPRLEITVNVNEIPGAPGVTNVAYCLNETATALTATGVTGATFNWFTEETGGTALSAAPTPDTAVAGSTTYYVSQNIGTNCEGPRSAITVTVNSPATQVTAFTIPATICLIDPNPIAATLDSGSVTGGTFASNNANLVIDAATGVIDLAASQAGTYNITYSVAGNISACLAPGFTMHTIVVTPLNPAVVNFTYPALCEAAANQLPNEANGFSKGGTYTSSDPANLVVDPVTGEINVAGSNPGTYTVTYTVAQDNVQCNAAGTSAAVPVTISPLTVPVVQFNYTSVCSASAATLSPATFGGFTTGGTFSSDNSNLVFTDAANGIIDLAASQPGVYNVTYTLAANNAGCVAAGTYTATVTIIQSVTPDASIVYESTYCSNTTTITPTAAFTAGGTFTVSGGLTINPSTGVITVGNAAPGTYQVTYTIPADATACNTGGTDTFSFSLGGEIEFTIEGNCEGPAYILTSAPTNNSFDPAAVSYQWSINNSPVGIDDAQFNVTEYISGTTTPSFPITVTLTVTNNGCSEFETFTIDGITCEIQRGISPGGTADKNDFFDLSGFGVRKLTIFNRYGKEVYSRNNYVNEWYGQTDNGDDLPNGTYFYAIDRNNGPARTGWIYVNRQN